MSDRNTILPSMRTRIIPWDEGGDGRTWINARKNGLGPTRSINIELKHDASMEDNHIAAAQAWLDKFIPGARVKIPGLNFNGDFYWAWDHSQEEGEQVDA